MGDSGISGQKQFGIHASEKALVLDQLQTDSNKIASQHVRINFGGQHGRSVYHRIVFIYSLQK